MKYNVQSELIFKEGDVRVDVTIVRGGSLNLVTTVPCINNLPVPFYEHETCQISYYFGQFVYTFDVSFVQAFSSEDTGESLYEFNIIGVDIEKNYRNQQRKNVQIKCVFLNMEGIDFATILDLSDNGLRIETTQDLRMGHVEVYFEYEDKKHAVRGKIMWKKKEKGNYQYGIQLV